MNEDQLRDQMILALMPVFVEGYLKEAQAGHAGTPLWKEGLAAQAVHTAMIAVEVRRKLISRPAESEEST